MKKAKIRIKHSEHETEKEVTEEQLFSLLKNGMMKMIKIIAAAELKRRGL